MRTYPTVTSHLVRYRVRGVMRSECFRDIAEAERFAASVGSRYPISSGEVPDVGTGTLAEELALRGYAYQPGAYSRKAITRNGRRVAELTADACWKWLARRDAKLRALKRELVRDPQAACREAGEVWRG